MDKTLRFVIDVVLISSLLNLVILLVEYVLK